MIFNARAPEILKQLQRPASAEKAAASFAPLLGDLLPKVSEKQLVRDNTELLGRLNPGSLPTVKPASTQSLETPQIEFVSPPQVSIPEPQEEAPSVKSPTLLSARRVSVPDPMGGLNAAERIEKIEQLALAAGKRHGVDPSLGLAVIAQESAFNPSAVSTDGFNSKGLMQLLDATGREQHALAGNKVEYRPFDPDLNVDLGVRYLRDLHNMFSVATPLSNGLSTQPAANSSSLEKLAVAAYNAGQGRVASAQQRAQKDSKNSGEYTDVEQYLPETTQEYVRRVLERRFQFESREGAKTNVG